MHMRICIPRQKDKTDNTKDRQLIVTSLTTTPHPTNKLCQLCQLGQLASSSWEISKSSFLQNSLLLPRIPKSPIIFPAKAPSAIRRAARSKTNVIATPFHLFSFARPEKFPHLLSRFIPAQRYPLARTPNFCSPGSHRSFPALAQLAPLRLLLPYFYRLPRSTVHTSPRCLLWFRSPRCRADCYLSRIACLSQ
jgi:hypothetical protein